MYSVATLGPSSEVWDRSLAFDMRRRSGKDALTSVALSILVRARSAVMLMLSETSPTVAVARVLCRHSQSYNILSVCDGSNPEKKLLGQRA